MSMPQNLEIRRQEIMPMLQERDKTTAAVILNTVMGPPLPKNFITPINESVPMGHDCSRCAAVSACSLLNKVSENNGDNPIARRIQAINMIKAEKPNFVQEMSTEERETLIREKTIALKEQSQRSNIAPKPEIPQVQIEEVAIPPSPTRKKSQKNKRILNSTNIDRVDKIEVTTPPQKTTPNIQQNTPIEESKKIKQRVEINPPSARKKNVVVTFDIPHPIDYPIRKKEKILFTEVKGNIFEYQKSIKSRALEISSTGETSKGSFKDRVLSYFHAVPFALPHVFSKIIFRQPAPLPEKLNRTGISQIKTTEKKDAKKRIRRIPKAIHQIFDSPIFRREKHEKKGRIKIRLLKPNIKIQETISEVTESKPTGLIKQRIQSRRSPISEKPLTHVPKSVQDNKGGSEYTPSSLNETSFLYFTSLLDHINRFFDIFNNQQIDQVEKKKELTIYIDMLFSQEEIIVDPNNYQSSINISFILWYIVQVFKSIKLFSLLPAAMLPGKTIPPEAIRR